MKHTPGPWHIHGADIHTDHVDKHGNQQHHIVASIASHLEGMDHPAGIPFEFSTEANAHLIAAAPELLEALEKLYSRSAAVLPREEDREYIENIIAKAKGET